MYVFVSVCVAVYCRATSFCSRSFLRAVRHKHIMWPIRAVKPDATCGVEKFSIPSASVILNAPLTSNLKSVESSLKRTSVQSSTKPASEHCIPGPCQCCEYANAQCGGCHDCRIQRRKVRTCRFPLNPCTQPRLAGSHEKLTNDRSNHGHTAGDSNSTDHPWKG